MPLEPPISDHVRIATYNIRKCRGMDQRRAPERVLSVLEALAADFVLLQEVDTRLPPRRATLDNADLEALGWKIAPFGSQGALGWHGNALLWRCGQSVLTDWQNIELPGLEPRGAIVAEFDRPNGPLRILGAHLGLTRSAREQQAAYLRNHLAKQTVVPTILAGDLNDWRPASDLVEQIGLGGEHRTASFPSFFPIASLDRIAHCDALQVSMGGVYSDGEARVASDHLPLWADLEYIPSANIAPAGSPISIPDETSQ